MNAFSAAFEAEYTAVNGVGRTEAVELMLMMDYAGDGHFWREEDIYNPANFGKLLEDWQAAKEKASS